MTGKEYQELAMRTNDRKGTDRLLDCIDNNTNMYWEDDTDKHIGGILNGCLGLAGETGEFNDIIKKWIFHEKPLDEEHAKKELGDIFWYLAMICESFGWDMDEIMQMNIEKLEKRYPIDEGFTIERANSRKEGDI